MIVDKDFKGDIYKIKNGKKALSPEYLKFMEKRIEKRIEEEYHQADYFVYETLKVIHNGLKTILKIGNKSKEEKKILDDYIKFSSTGMFALSTRYDKQFRLIDRRLSTRGKPSYLVELNKKEYPLNETQYKIIEYCVKYYRATPFKFNEDVADALELNGDYLSEYFKNRKDDFFEKMFTRVKGQTDYYHLNIPNWK